ncbi:MAG TPA: excinuclease ABC subunit UvrA, partial [Dehalococcoidia bacterium]|nr:excinuclease ABC subunit UvrA [Dehalococcoidia bacterium]
FSEHFACPYCGISLGNIAPRNFSFNSPHGACPACTGLGIKLEIDPSLVISNRNISIAEGAIDIMGFSNYRLAEISTLAYRHGFSTHVPIAKLSEEHLNLILYGENGESAKGDASADYYYNNKYEGVIPTLQRLYRDTESINVRAYIERFLVSSPCPVCQGKRLKPEALAVTVNGKNIIEITGLSAHNAARWVETLSGVKQDQRVLSETEYLIAAQILKEIRTRINFLIDIGLGYLTLDRPSSTLSGGEFQRIRLATQIGSGLMGVLYICDEPTIGLHPADIYRLVDTIKKLRDLGNTVIIVEHDETMMRAADHIIDMGPGAGENGGYVVASGAIQEIMDNPSSLTGQYLSKKRQIATPAKRRKGNGERLVIKNASENNLKNIDVIIPLGMLVCISGVSGSGKSTLINEVLYKNLAQQIYRSRTRPGRCDEIRGLEHIDKVINIDQSPIGRTPRSNPSTYTGTFTPIRELFATVPEARMKGYKPGRFSFNVKGGRCETCQGAGYIQIEMQFLPDVTVPCDICKGKRYNEEALEVKFKGRNIAEVLNMTVDEACNFFQNIPRIKRKLETLKDVGLGYIKLGQPAPTLSGGEAQRVKLAAELSKHSTGKTLYILDEPTTGLSFSDIDCLLQVLQRLAGKGNTVIIIEHHMDVLKNADHIIDLGPGPGDDGGYVVATGTPEAISQIEASHTGRYLKETLK